MTRELQYSANKDFTFSELLARPRIWLVMAVFFGYATDGFIGLNVSRSALSAKYGTAASGGSDTIDNTIMFLLLSAISLPLLVLRANALFRVAKANVALLLLSLWAVASVAWSQFPQVTLQWAPATVFCVILTFYLSASFSLHTQLRLLLCLGTICLLLTIVLSSVPEYRDPVGGWRGIYAQKNMCCMNTEFLLIPALYANDICRDTFFKVFRMSYILLSVVVIIFSQSSTGLLVLPILLVVCMLGEVVVRFDALSRVSIIVVVTSVTCAVAIVAVTRYVSIAEYLGKDPTLTGRTEIWRALLQSIMNHPLLGYGYRAFWRGYEGESATVSLVAHWAVPSAHNALLEIIVTLGFVGLFMMLWICVKAVRDSIMVLLRRNSNHARWLVAIIVLMLLNSLDEAQMLIPFGLGWFLFALSAVNLSMFARAHEEGTQ